MTACELGKDGNENTAAKILPTNTEAFVSASLSPSVEQKTALFQLSKRFPAKVQASDIDSFAKKTVDDAVKDTGLTYDSDIKSWLGAEAGIAVLPPETSGGDPGVVALLSVKDEGKAKAALDKAKLPITNYRFVGDYVGIVDKNEVDTAPGILNAIEASERDKGDHLADTSKYKDSIGKLNGEHLLLGYADFPALARTASDIKKADGSSSLDGALGGLGGGALSSAENIDDKSKADLLAQVDKIGAISFSAYATANSVVLESVNNKQEAGLASGDAAAFKNLPLDTLAALSISSLGDSLDKALDTSNPDSFLSKQLTDTPSLKDQINAPLPAAAISLLRSIDGEVTVSVGNVAGAVPEVAVQAKTSKGTDANAAMTKLVTEARSLGLSINDTTLNGKPAYGIVVPQGESQITVVAGVLDNSTIVVSTSDTYATKVLNGGQFGTSDQYKKAFGDTARATTDSALFLDLSTAATLANQAGAFAGDEDAAAWSQVVDKLGVYSWTDETVQHSELRLSFK